MLEVGLEGVRGEMFGLDGGRYGGEDGGRGKGERGKGGRERVVDAHVRGLGRRVRALVGEEVWMGVGSMGRGVVGRGGKAGEGGRGEVGGRGGEEVEKVEGVVKAGMGVE